MNIPKKLDVINRDDHAERFLCAAGIEDTFEIRNKINELIDYLQAKEEEMSFMLDIVEERGYWQGRKEAKEEASKGECACSYYDWNRGTPNEKCMVHNPPEHEESWEQGFDKKFTVRTVGVNSNAIKQYFEAIKDYIRDSFVSKEKIKEYVSDKLNCYSNPDYRVAFKDLSESLGLGD